MQFSSGRFESQRSGRVSVWLGMSQRRAGLVPGFTKAQTTGHGRGRWATTPRSSLVRTPETVQRGHTKKETKFVKNITSAVTPKAERGCG